MSGDSSPQKVEILVDDDKEVVLAHTPVLVYADGGVKPLSDPYPDGTPLCHERNVHSVLVRHVPGQGLHPLAVALTIVESLNVQHRTSKFVPLYLPYFPGARQDRVNTERGSDVLVTAQAIARMVNAVRPESVTVVDPHSDVTPALLENARVVHAAQFVDEVGDGFQAVLAPDGGAEKRAMRCAKALGVPLIHGWKTRDVATGKITGFGCESVVDVVGVGGKVLVVDDVCDGGGTFLGLADKVPLSVELHLYVTHGLFSQGTTKLRQRFAGLYCTDSVLAIREGVKVIPICNRLLEGEL